MGKISDIWVRLGLKKQEFDKGIDDAGKKADGFGGTLGKIKAGALAVWGAIGAEVVALAKQFVNASQTMSDKWNLGVNQMKAVWSQFLTSLTNWDWEGFGNRIKDAMEAASASTLAHDAEFEVGNSIKMRRAAMAEELASLEVLMRNTQKSYAERAKAAQDYLNKVEPLYQQEIDLRKRIYLTDTDEYLKNAGLEANATNRDLLRTFFTDVIPNESLVAVLNEYQKKVQGKKKYKLSQADYQVIDAFYNQYGNKAGAALSVLAQYYQGSNDDTATKAINAIVNYDNALAAFLAETRRVRTVQNTALAQMGKDSKDGLGVTRIENLPGVGQYKGLAEVQMPDLITKEWLERQKQMGLEAVEWQGRILETMANATQIFEDSLVSSMMNGLQAITDLMMGVEGADMKNVLAAFIAPLGDTMKQIGAMIMAEGVAMEAFKASFKTPGAAIAAGAALMAIGSLVSSGLQRLTANPVGGGSGVSYGGGGSYGSTELQNYESTLTVKVVGRISGSDIILAGQNQQNKWNR